MKYSVTVHATTFEVEIDGDHVTLNGKPHDADLAGVAHTPLRQLVMDGRSRVLAVSPGEDGWVVQMAGERWVALVENERTRMLREMTGQRHGRPAGGFIRAPMPGLVLRVEVEEGQRVAAGAGVVVLEAMKMENEITTPGPGIVAKVHVQAGAAVEKGTPLVEIAPQG